MIHVKNAVELVELNVVQGLEASELIVESVPGFSIRLLVVGKGWTHEVVVSRADLLAAVQNAHNTGEE